MKELKRYSNFNFIHLFRFLGEIENYKNENRLLVNEEIEASFVNTSSGFL